MKRTADHLLLALGAAAVFAMLSGQGDPARPTDAPSADAAPRVAQADGATTTDLAAPARTRGRSHWHGQIDRPAQTVGPELTSEMIDLCMEVAHDLDEGLARKLEVLRARDVKQFEAKLRRSRRLTAMAELKKRDGATYQLKLTELAVDAAVSRLAGEVRTARKAGREAEARALEDELRGQTIVQLGFRHRAREDYLCRLRELVDRLERELKDERENFDRVLEYRMAELLAEPRATPRRDSSGPEDLSGSDLAARVIVPE